MASERLAMYIQGVENVYDIQWTDDYTYGDVFNRTSMSSWPMRLTFDEKLLFELFDKYEAEAVRVNAEGYVHPAYDYVFECSHAFNPLDGVSCGNLGIPAYGIYWSCSCLPVCVQSVI